jgi:uncharacterized membrane protein
MTRDPLFIFAVLCLLIVASEWLARRSGFRHLGSALIVILLGALVANVGVIPAGSPPDAPVAVYDTIFTHVAPIALFWLLLHVNLRSLLKVGLPIVALFLAGSAGTLLGAVVAMRAINGTDVIGPMAGPVAGMFTGTYIGGGINFNAIALHYGVVREGGLFAGATVVDNIVTTVWIVVTLAVPRLFAVAWTARSGGARVTTAPIVELQAEIETRASLAGLMNAMQAADVAPTANTRAAVEAALANAKTAMAKYVALKGKALPALNVRLRAVGVAEIR